VQVCSQARCVCGVQAAASPCSIKTGPSFLPVASGNQAEIGHLKVCVSCCSASKSPMGTGRVEKIAQRRGGRGEDRTNNLIALLQATEPEPGVAHGTVKLFEVIKIHRVRLNEMEPGGQGIGVTGSAVKSFQGWFRWLPAGPPERRRTHSPGQERLAKQDWSSGDLSEGLQLGAGMNFGLAEDGRLWTEAFDDRSDMAADAW
jgi:hypothetical protein